MQSLRVALVALVMASASAFIAHTPARSAWTAARPTASRTAVELQSAVVEDIMDKLKGLTLLEASELVKEIEDTFGVDASAGGGGMMMAMPAAAGGGDAAADAGEEQTEFDIMLTDVPADKKIAILKVVRTITGLGLKEAKEVVEGAPSVLKKEVKKDEAEEILKKLTELGAAAELE